MGKRKKRSTARKSLSERRRDALPKEVQRRAQKMTRAATWPLRECVINEKWREVMLACIHIVRERPDGNLAVGVFLVDLGCLGVKQARATSNMSRLEYLDQRQLANREDDPLIPCPLEEAIAIINAGLEWSARFSFLPAPEFHAAKLIYDDADSPDVSLEIPCGHEGRPLLFIASRDDEDGMAYRLHLEAQVGVDGVEVVYEDERASL